MTKLNDSAAEQAKNVDIIAALAQETRRPVDEVKEVYDVEFPRLKTSARIGDYVALFASRSTKARLSRGAPRVTKDETAS